VLDPALRERIELELAEIEPTVLDPALRERIELELAEIEPTVLDPMEREVELAIVAEELEPVVLEVRGPEELEPIELPTLESEFERELVELAVLELAVPEPEITPRDGPCVRIIEGTLPDPSRDTDVVSCWIIAI
jgi:hypothetical protein